MAIQDYSPELLLRLYRQMLMVREFELRAIAERRAGLIPGFIHSCVGQEATAAGACAALEPSDVISSTHRGHGHLVAKGGEPKYMMAELAARTTGYCGGKGGSLHMTDFNLGILGANGIVGGGIPIAVGAGLAFQQRKEPRVALSFFGDGATNEGSFHEALNLAGAVEAARDLLLREQPVRRGHAPDQAGAGRRPGDPREQLRHARRDRRR